MVYKTLNDMALIYFRDMLEYKTASTRSLTSDDERLLVVLRSHPVIDCNFRHVAFNLWNGLLDS